ncbi:MAG TPA: hypothetical protein VGM15_00770 [Burkholderiaceae bacterium]
MGMSMLTIAISLFLVAATGGLTMAIFIFKNRYPPFFLIGAHGFFGLGALALAIWTTGMPGTPSLVDYGIVAIMLGAVGGIFLISFQFRNEAQPKIVVVLHALVAVSGVSCLLLALLDMSRLARPVEWYVWSGH